MSPDELLEAEVLIYLRGLGFPTDRASAGEKRRAAAAATGGFLRFRRASRRSLGQAEIKLRK